MPAHLYIWTIGLYALPIADVTPFHIVGGHITTTLSPSQFSLVAANIKDGIELASLKIPFKNYGESQVIYELSNVDINLNRFISQALTQISVLLLKQIIIKIKKGT